MKDVQITCARQLLDLAKIVARFHFALLIKSFKVIANAELVELERLLINHKEIALTIYQLKLHAQIIKDISLMVNVALTNASQGKH